MFIPSSSRRGGSSSKFVLPLLMVLPNWGVEKDVDAGDDPMSNDMKGIPAFADLAG